MKINKLYTGIVLAGALMVSGCGSDDDGEYVGGGSGNGGPIVNNELNYATFDPFSDVVNRLTPAVNPVEPNLGDFNYAA